MEPKILIYTLFYFIPTLNFIQAKVIDSLAGKRDFSLHCKIQAGSGAHPVGTRGFLPARIKLPVHDAYQLAPSCAKMKNVWSYSSTPSYAFTAYKAILYLYTFKTTYCTKSASCHEKKRNLHVYNIT
jgi:hypothetical protein